MPIPTSSSSLLRRTACLLAWCCLWGGPRALEAQEVVAVLSSDLAPYREAYAGFTAALDTAAAPVSLQTGRPRIGRDTKVVVAFGSRAAGEDYPQDVPLVYCMAPGTTLDAGQRHGPTIRVSMLPPAAEVVGLLKEIQGPLSNLAVLWIVDTMDGYAKQMQEAGGARGIEVVAERLRSADQLPDYLRHLAGEQVEALWLMPDPLLISANSFALLREFSRANKIPLYAPTAGFAGEGAAAAVGISFAQNGRTAGEVVRALLAGRQTPSEVYPDEFEITLNESAAAAAGLRFSPETRQRADKIFP